MATKTKKVPQEEQGSEILDKTAKVIGAALGAVAAKTGVAHPEKPKKVGKLIAKDKKRLPRREKKRAQKAAAKEPRRTGVKPAMDS